MQFSTFTQILLLAVAPVAMANVAADPAGKLNVFETRQQCIKTNCGGVGAGCAGDWCCVPYNGNGCKCIPPGDVSETGVQCPRK
ncbi:hypothetical protein Cob_v007523 [Colletotrichum orbiculare MAFF 240422]|uniref:Uncharacterized protein n=3 Tax=Colletotrichum orbiculare species complex TaxID=2707354 RepID=N4V4R1_COLOR|nr:hypothetical protein Cob_v007523 [Colletotrichum orbiculare MAFF 240422]TDZ35723.1 hypothetical protein C8035_v007195 [Colletotrichum spinosum]